MFVAERKIRKWGAWQPRGRIACECQGGLKALHPDVRRIGPCIWINFWWVNGRFGSVWDNGASKVWHDHWVLVKADGRGLYCSLGGPIVLVIWLLGLRKNLHWWTLQWKRLLLQRIWLGQRWCAAWRRERRQPKGVTWRRDSFSFLFSALVLGWAQRWVGFVCAGSFSWTGHMPWVLVLLLQPRLHVRHKVTWISRMSGPV